MDSRLKGVRNLLSTLDLVDHLFWLLSEESVIM